MSALGNSLQTDRRNLYNSRGHSVLQKLAKQRRHQYRILSQRIEREKKMFVVSQKIQARKDIMEKREKVKVKKETVNSAPIYKFKKQRKR
ncbi:hypothetical protein GDO81_005934 [Engystomops pustulosus]|uniref:U3 small nucleolar RNA-associated protein 11 n=1 Tax=Engystomops pustulosus TaxID=76066 RepID=A0AAV7CTV2_ENGPU|nr:hypothetical protein GDO81_005934 [Engystomops pustulosus]